MRERFILCKKKNEDNYRVLNITYNYKTGMLQTDLEWLSGDIIRGSKENPFYITNNKVFSSWDVIVTDVDYASHITEVETMSVDKSYIFILYQYDGVYIVATCIGDDVMLSLKKGAQQLELMTKAGGRLNFILKEDLVAPARLGYAIVTSGKNITADRLYYAIKISTNVATTNKGKYCYDKGVLSHRLYAGYIRTHLNECSKTTNEKAATNEVYKMLVSALKKEGLS